MDAVIKLSVLYHSPATSTVTRLLIREADCLTGCTRDSRICKNVQMRISACLSS